MAPVCELVLVLGGGVADASGDVDSGVAALVAPGAVVVAADSGVDAALALGLTVHHVVGDLDSVSAEGLAAAEAAGAEVHRYPADKDATDSELALDLVIALAAGATLPEVERGATEPPGLLVLGVAGGRLDHLLGDVHLLAGPLLAGLEVTARLGPATVTVVRAGRAREISGPTGGQVSLLPLGGRARGVTTTALRWALVDADLVAGTSRAMSNELTGGSATVAIDEGVLVVVQPGTVADPISPRTTPYDPTPRDHEP